MKRESLPLLNAIGMAFDGKGNSEKMNNFLNCMRNVDLVKKNTDIEKLDKLAENN